MSQFNFNDNNLTSIPDGIFTNLTNLEWLILKDSTSSDEMNSFDCTADNYRKWGLNPSSLPSMFTCN